MYKHFKKLFQEVRLYADGINFLNKNLIVSQTKFVHFFPYWQFNTFIKRNNNACKATSFHISIF